MNTSRNIVSPELVILYDEPPKYVDMLRYCIVISLLLSGGLTLTQLGVTLSGYIRNVETGEELIGAVVFMKE